jgi:general L-amino acid transport system permease protein
VRVFVGARWEIIVVNLTNLMVGNFPRDQLWRLWVAMAIMAIVMGLLIGVTAAASRDVALATGQTPVRPGTTRSAAWCPPVLFSLVMGRSCAPSRRCCCSPGWSCSARRRSSSAAAARERRKLRQPRRHRRGVAAADRHQRVRRRPATPVGRAAGHRLLHDRRAAAGLPDRVAVAIGPPLDLPVVRWTCSVYVEFFRGSPLIVLLFIGWLVLPFMFPPEWENITRVSRALIIFTLFTSAYVAEIVRGGLQSIPRASSRRPRRSGCRRGSRPG